MCNSSDTYRIWSIIETSFHLLAPCYDGVRDVGCDPGAWQASEVHRQPPRRGPINHRLWPLLASGTLVPPNARDKSKIETLRRNDELQIATLHTRTHKYRHTMWVTQQPCGANCRVKGLKSCDCSIDRLTHSHPNYTPGQPATCDPSTHMVWDYPKVRSLIYEIYVSPQWQIKIV